MSVKGKKARSTRDNFCLSTLEREMLTELKNLLEMFEFATNEFQTNEVSCSRVYPQVNSLSINLLKNIDTFKHTKQLRIDLCKGLKERFGALIENDVFTTSTFLDPDFNILAFEPSRRASVISQVKVLIRAQQTFTEQIPNICETHSKTESNYVLYEEEESTAVDELDTMVDNYLKAAKASALPALEFWKQYKNIFPHIASLAQKYLRVPASSAGPERIFSISGHIFSLKRRRLGAIFFSDLVFLKLNENYYE